MFAFILGTDDPSLSLVMLEATFVAILGLSFGSFASAIAHRVPRGVSWVSSGERSKCPSCTTTLTARDLFPVLSWFINKGKCRHCAAPVPAFYPMLEIASAVLCLLIFFVHQGPAIETYLFILSVPFLLSLLVIDLRHKILPNQLIFIFAGIGGAILLYKLSNSYNAQALLSIHIGGALLFAFVSYALGWSMQKLLKKDALGMGDVKFFAASGLWLGVLPIGTFCMLSGFLGVVLAFAWRVKTGEHAFPFGPALIIAFFLIFLLDGSFLLEKAVQYF